MKHYSVIQLLGTNDEKWHELITLFTKGPCYLNMLFGGSGGVHGPRGSLRSIERDWNNEEEDKELSILVLHPRLVSLIYGTLLIRDKEDIDWLRGTITKSCNYFIDSQRGNIDEDKLINIKDGYKLN